MILALVMFNSCKKQNSCIAGTGGPVMVAVFPKYDGRAVYNLQNYRDTAYVKFNTHNSPGTSTKDFDLVVSGNAGEDHVHLLNLKCGDYFIYMTGLDTTLNKRVSGGIPITLTQDYGIEVDYDVPLSE
ncbi:MAG: hypothetical protein ACHQD9_06715 [Chitinophagales bacterium]